MAWAAALGGAAGGALGGILGIPFAAYQSARARRWQQEVMENQIQWRVKDMKAAGINPLLAAGGLGGGGAPSAPIVGAGGGAGSGIVSSAMQAARASEELRKLRSEAKTQEWIQKEAMHRANAAEFMPQQAMANWLQTHSTSRLQNARAQLDEFSSAEAGARARFYQSRLGQAGVVWNEAIQKFLGTNPVGGALGAAGRVGGAAMGTRMYR